MRYAAEVSGVLICFSCVCAVLVVLPPLYVIYLAGDALRVWGKK